MNETTKTTMDTIDQFLSALAKDPRLTAQERIALGQTQNAISDLLEELDTPYDEIVLDMTGRITSWKG